MNAEDQTAGNKDEHRNLLKVLHSALQETDRCAGYALEAEELETSGSPSSSERCR